MSDYRGTEMAAFLVTVVGMIALMLTLVLVIGFAIGNEGWRRLFLVAGGVGLVWVCLRALRMARRRRLTGRWE